MISQKRADYLISLLKRKFEVLSPWEIVYDPSRKRKNMGWILPNGRFIIHGCTNLRVFLHEIFHLVLESYRYNHRYNRRNKDIEEIMINDLLSFSNGQFRTSR